MNWTKVVTHPLGFAAFALALVFGAGSQWHQGMPSWWPPVAIALAAICAGSGIFFYHAKAKVDRASPVTQNASASGSGSTAINLSGKGNSIGRATASGTEKATRGSDTAKPASVDQQAKTGEKGVALNINGNGNAVSIPEKQ